MDFASFNAVARLSDVFLDSIGWSGFNSLLESLVGYPSCHLARRNDARSPQRRGHGNDGRKRNHCHGHPHLHQYRCAAGLDRTWRQAVAACIPENKHKAYNNAESVRGLENFLVGAVERGTNG